MQTFDVKNALKSNRQMYKKFTLQNIDTAKNFLSYANTSSKPETEYYNDPKKKKKGKIFKFSVLAVSIITIGTLLLKGKASKPLNEALEKFNIKDLKELDLGHKFSNFISNVVNVKDDINDRCMAKFKDIPVLNFPTKVAQWIKGVYKKGISSAMKPKYENAFNSLKKAGYNGELIEFDKWYENINNAFYQRFQLKDNRITNNLFNKNFFKTMSSSNIADGKIKDIIEHELIKTPENASEALQKAIKEYNGVQHILLPKLRDVNCGSAITDLFTIIASIGGLSAAAVTADNKEERKSILIDFGIPLLTTLGATTFATVKCISGARSLLFGLATGQIAKLAAKKINQTSENKKEIIT